ncbi:MAG: hypothetical protein AMXMBFR8_03180 [Nevskiales bacterium]
MLPPGSHSRRSIGNREVPASSPICGPKVPGLAFWLISNFRRRVESGDCTTFTYGPQRQPIKQVTMCPIWDSGSGSACGGGDEVERLASGEDADVAERAEFEQIAIAGDDKDRLCAKGAGEDVIIVGVAQGGRDHGGPPGRSQRAVAYRGQYRVWLFALFKMTGIVPNLK